MDNRRLYGTRAKRRSYRKWWLGATFLLLISGYLGWTLSRPLPALKPTQQQLSLQAAVNMNHLNWPASGQAAVGVMGSDDILDTHGEQKPAPIASAAKVITALVVLQQKPLAAGQTGPTVTLTDADVAIYQKYAAQDSSLVPVVTGEQINEYQMLQAIMLPSANNIADSMAIWAYGSLPAYATAANHYLTANGIYHTHIGSDASGLSPTTTSTAEDLVKLGKLAMHQPVLASVVSQSTATGIPQTSTVKNVNSLLGTANIVGIKTGNTDEAGGVFISASKITLNSKPVTIITAVVGATNLSSALRDSLSLVQSAQTNFSAVKVVRSGSIVGRYEVPWDGSIPAVANSDLVATTWNNHPISAKVQLQNANYHSSAAGQITLPDSVFNQSASTAVELQHQPAPPTIWWRMTHPF